MSPRKARFMALREEWLQFIAANVPARHCNWNAVGRGLSMALAVLMSSPRPPR